MESLCIYLQPYIRDRLTDYLESYLAEEDSSTEGKNLKEAKFL